MKILWITNMLLPDAAEYLGVGTGSSGTWMIDISQKLSQAENVELAHEFINYILEYEIAYANAEYNGYASTHQDVLYEMVDVFEYAKKVSNQNAIWHLA